MGIFKTYFELIKSHIQTDKTFLHNVIWTTLGYAGRLLLQVAYFIIVARVLGVSNFGLFSGILGLVSVLVPFSSMGSGLILIKHVSRNPETFPLYWGTAISVTLLVGAVLCLAITGLGTIIYSPLEAIMIILPVAIGELFGVRFTELSGQAFQAHQRLSRTSSLWVLLSFFRLVAALLLLIMPVEKPLQMWALIYMLSGLLAGACSIIWVHKELGRGKLGLTGMRGEWRNGFYFSVSTSASGAYNDLDKTMLSRLSTDTIAGAYSAAYRVVDAIYIPIRAIVASSYPRFFQVGKNGLKTVMNYAFRLMPLTIVVSVIAWGGMVLIAPILPDLLGQEYSLTPIIAVWLGPILIFRTIHNLLANTLTGADFQGLRSAIQVGIALFNLGLNLLWIPIYGWKGALWSSLLSDGGLAFLLFFLILWLNKRKS